MYEEARLYAAALRKFGLKKGDVVACYMSNRIEAVIAMLSVTSIGAIFTGALPQLGPQAVISRFQIVKPKLLFSVDRYRNNNEEIEMLMKLEEIAEALPSLRKIVIVPSKEESKFKDISKIKNSCFLHDFLSTGREADGSVAPTMFEQVSFSHPVFINYTSGTTGLPKALFVGAASLLSVTRDFGSYGNEVRERVWFSVSPVGWVTWNIFSSMHFLGCTVVLFEGVPYFLSKTSLWDLIDEFKVTHIVLPPSILDDMEKKGYLPTERNSLSSLETIISAGSVVKPQNYDFVCNKIKKGILFFSGFGCTELMGFSAGHDPSLPVYRGELTAPSLGTDLQCLDEEGKPVIGEAGEMVIAKPFPSLVLGIWGDSDGSVFKEKYFSKFPGKFSIGDLVVINPVTRGFIVCGRSDATLKPGGCRFGSSEIYNIVI
ncbi:acetoacetyl-CoA synthetase-like isoform X2 [Stegodyphus dumicola]|uniref:acetoacetyl-CoA synthetase-like isoform X2 n=1 Tax=Stegodyphus dumicola TaxID=202533 RepID=UPI0015AA7655|nr:acetoacetyl-CoA synthetase-like isoform X2 [Stegodyphus dumicola]